MQEFGKNTLYKAQLNLKMTFEGACGLSMVEYQDLEKSGHHSSRF